MKTTTATNLHYVHVLSLLFRDFDHDNLQAVLQAGRQLQLEPGAFVFEQGDHNNALYIVLSGRLRAVVQDEHAMHILGDIGEGEPAGEFALFTNEPRMASVLAIRKTTVLEINKQQYEALVARNPSFAATLTGVLIGRLKRNMLERHLSAIPRNIALVNLQADHDLSPWTRDIEKTFRESGTPIYVYDHTSATEGDQAAVFDSLEQHMGMNILVCSEAHPEWSRQCLLYADLVIVATDFKASPELYPVEQLLDLYSQSILNKKIYIVFLHKQNAPFPAHTQRWLARRKVNLHIHVRKNNARDVRRFCRIIAHQAVGVVLGGGGAKGYAHVGAVRALMDAGIEIDFIGGTSAGALYGVVMSHCDFSFAQIDRLCEASAKGKLTSNDFSLPIISMMSGRKINRFIKEIFGDSHLEDIWVNSYCVSTNFSSSAITVHDRGLTSKMVQASIAIPGVFPPVVIDKQLHVDGGVVDNLPIEPMYRYPVRYVIAISLSSLNTRYVDYAEVPSAGKLFWDKLTGRKKYRIPSISSLIINSLMLNSYQKQELNKSKVSLYFEMDLKGVGLLDDKKWELTIKKGHDQMKTFLEQVPEKEKFWLYNAYISR